MGYTYPVKVRNLRESPVSIGTFGVATMISSILHNKSSTQTDHYEIVAPALLCVAGVS